MHAENMKVIQHIKENNNRR